jgi:hypothetical protein
MAYTKTIDAYYKEVKIVLDLTTNKFSIDHMDLDGEYDTMEAAEKAVRDWLKPEVAEEKVGAVDVLVRKSAYRDDGGFYEATTRFAVHSRRWGTRVEYWVTKKKTQGSYDKKKEAIEGDRIFLDTPENRAVFAELKANQEVFNKAQENFNQVSSNLAKKLTNAKPKV